MDTNLKAYTCNEKSKVFILFGFMLMFGVNLIAQDVIKTANKPCFAVSADKMNVLYAGIPNPVTVAASVSPEKLLISWGGATATELGNRRYDVMVPDSFVGKTILFLFSAEIEEGKIQSIGAAYFRVKPIPEPDVYVGADITGGYQSKERLLANPLIVARMSPDFNFDLRWEVVSYKVIFIINGDEEAPIMVNGARFSELVLNKIKDAPSGTMIEFSEIKIQSTAGMRNITKTFVVRIR